MRYTSARMVSATVFSGDMKGSLLYDSTQALNLGTSAATSHALGTGDVLVGGDLEVDGDIYADSTLVFEGSTTFNKGLITFSATNSRIQTADRVGGVKTLDLDILTGNQTNAADVATGAVSIYTGATTTDGDTGDITLYTGAAGAGAADAGDIIFAVNGGPGVGTTALTIEGATGDIITGRPIKTASGALTFSPANATIIHSSGVKTGLTDASANDLVAVAMPLSSHVSGRLNIAVHADDGTDFQIRRTTVLFAAVRVAGGGITIDTQVAAASSAAAFSGGTLSVTVASADNGDGTFKLTVTPNSSLTPTTLEAHYWVELDEDYVLTQY